MNGRDKPDRVGAGVDTMAPGRSSRTEPTTLYRALRDDILRGRLAPGARLGVRALVRSYDAGPIPLREALNRLHAERLVLHEARRGFFVGAVSVDDVRDLTQTRIWLYSGALRRSIEIGDDAWEEGVVLSFYRLAKFSRNAGAAQALRSEEWLDPHRAFHASLIAGCGSNRTIEMSERLFDEAERYRYLSRLATPRTSVHEEHQQIMEAAVARRADEAIEALSSHLTRTCEAVIDYLRTTQA